MALLSPAGLEFVTDRRLATFSSLRPDGRPHVTPVGFTWDDAAGLARVICNGDSRKARHVRGNGAVALCQFEGRLWLALEGIGRVCDEPAAVAEAVARYAERYRPPRANPARVVIEITVDRVLGSAGLRGA